MSRRTIAAIAELVRVLKLGGALAITVPRWLPDEVCWVLSDEYHANEGGHIRIYRADAAARQDRRPRHAVHPHPSRARAALAVLVAEMRCRNVENDHPAVAAYHKLLVWDMMRAAVADPDGRVAAEPADRQERRAVLREAGGAPLTGS